MSGDGPQGVPMGIWPEVHAMPGAVDALAALYKTVPLCVATNATVSDRAMIKRALSRAGLLRYISEVFCSTELGCGKESREFWRSIANRFDLRMEAIAMLGDVVEADVIAPARFGIFSVWFNADGYQPCPIVPVQTVTRLEDFVKLIEPRLVVTRPDRSSRKQRVCDI